MLALLLLLAVPVVPVDPSVTVALKTLQAAATTLHELPYCVTLHDAAPVCKPTLSMVDLTLVKQQVTTALARMKKQPDAQRTIAAETLLRIRQRLSSVGHEWLSPYLLAASAVTGPTTEHKLDSSGKPIPDDQ